MLEESGSKLTAPNTHGSIPLLKVDLFDQDIEVSEQKSVQDAPLAMTKEANAEKSPTVQSNQNETCLLTDSLWDSAAFCRALDQTIVSTALPKLASQFNALDELTWVVSAYFLTQASLMLTLGQILTITPSKWVYIICIILFEIGSLICGIAPSMNVLIFGRAFQGIGSSGIFVSILTILSQITKLEQRPLLFGSFSGVWAVASVIGPLFGGTFTDKVTWRWCFYINLPFGAVSVAAAIFFIPSNASTGSRLYNDMTSIQKWLAMDWIGAIISIGMITALLIIFLGWESFKGERAMLPLFLFKRRTLAGASKGRTAAQSGIDIIPFMLSVVITSFGSGAFVNITGHYWSLMVLGPLIEAVGAGLLFTIDEHTIKQVFILSIDSILSIVYRIAIAGTVFNNQLSKTIAQYASSLPPEMVRAVKQSVTVIFSLPPELQGQV
ncbi:10904_t:CDS:2, partial [Acaulospora colombiana]